MSAKLAARGAKRFGAVGAGANTAEMIVAEDTCRMAIGKRDLNGVIANGRCRLRACLGLEHRQRCGRCRAGAGHSALPDPFVVASGARAFLTKISEIVMTRMTVRPGNVHARATCDMNFYRGRLFAGIDGDGHRSFGSR